MKKFKFRLEALQKCRKIEEDQQKKTFSIVRKRAVDKENEISELRMQFEKITLAESKDFSIATMRQNALYLAYLKEKEERIKTELESIKKEEELERVKLLDASRKRKIILKLREKNWQEYLEEYAMEENKRINEAGQMLFIKKVSS